MKLTAEMIQKIRNNELKDLILTEVASNHQKQNKFLLNQLAAALAHNTSLERIRIGKIDCSDKLLAEILANSSQNPHLKIIDLEDAEIGLDGAAAIEEVLQQRKIKFALPHSALFKNFFAAEIIQQKIIANEKETKRAEQELRELEIASNESEQEHAAKLAEMEHDFEIQLLVDEAEIKREVKLKLACMTEEEHLKLEQEIEAKETLDDSWEMLSANGSEHEREYPSDATTASSDISSEEDIHNPNEHAQTDVAQLPLKLSTPIYRLVSAHGVFADSPKPATLAQGADNSVKGQASPNSLR